MKIQWIINLFKSKKIFSSKIKHNIPNFENLSIEEKCKFVLNPEVLPTSEEFDEETTQILLKNKNKQFTFESLTNIDTTIQERDLFENCLKKYPESIYINNCLAHIYKAIFQHYFDNKDISNVKEYGIKSIKIFSYLFFKLKKAEYIIEIIDINKTIKNKDELLNMMKKYQGNSSIISKILEALNYIKFNEGS